jgi:hypothetical protein
MKTRLLFLLAILLLTLNINFACNKETQTPDPRIEPEYQSDNPISDLVLIYDGGLHRKPWTTDQMRPYIYRENSGKTEYLFDGFLFLEIFDDKKNVEYYPGFKKNPAAKADWQSLLDTYFSDQKSLGALESIMEELSLKGQKPLRKRQVVISIPTPIKGFGNWGEVNGKTLDFNNPSDQLTAVKWYIDETIQRWKEKKYKHIELSGFYWVTEDCGSNYAEVVKLTKQYIAQQGKKFCWIPYWNANGGDHWKEFGFDYAYEQPNYFFNTTIPYSRLNDACAFGAKHGLGMEMEFDYRVSKPEFKTRFDDYIKAFTENNIWKLRPMAYYEGGGAWGGMATSTNAELKKMYQTLGDIIVERQKQADKRIKNK